VDVIEWTTTPAVLVFNISEQSLPEKEAKHMDCGHSVNKLHV
jgi:hypothetical protein